MSDLATATLTDGSPDIDRAAADLAARLPAPLEPVARLAYNYLWSWWPGGADVFRMIDPDRWERELSQPDAPALRDVVGDPRARGRGRDAARSHRIPHRDAEPRAEPPIDAVEGHAGTSGRVPLRRVRGAPVAADLRGWPRRARRGHPQTGVGHGVADGGRGPPLPPGILPAAHGPVRVPDRVLAPGRPRACSCRPCL